jgi:outer membrane protein TolC
MHRLRVTLVAALVALPLAAEEPEWKTRLAEAIARAVAKNPSVAEMEARIQAAAHRAGQASALPDPEIEIAIQDIPPSDFSISRDDFTMSKITARQSFPGPGKRPARERSAEAAAQSASAMHAEHVMQLAADVADAFFALGDLDARLAILDASRARLDRVAASALERYRVGKGAQTDVLRANLEVTATRERRIALEGERRAAAARFNAFQDLSPQTPVASVGLPDDEPSPSLPPAAQLSADAEARSPAVAASEARIRQADEDLSLARLERRPDWMAEGYYAHRVNFEDLVGASIAVNLPFVRPRRLREREAEREAELSGARASLQMTRNEIRRRVAEAYADLDRAREQAAVYRGAILPQADVNASASQEAYAVGQVDFPTYVRAALDRDAYAAELSMRRADAWRAVAAIQRASGLPLLPGTPGMEVAHARP